MLFGAMIPEIPLLILNSEFIHLLCFLFIWTNRESMAGPSTGMLLSLNYSQINSCLCSVIV